uniref:HNH endonuclease n=1 Tax=Bursaphelenchus xylophilus TaxID=6326 RepID=A0A1I7SJU0_BURXY
MEGAFALAFKSRRFPGQLVATRRGSPLVVGIKSDARLSSDHFPVYFSKEAGFIWQDDKKLRNSSGKENSARIKSEEIFDQLDNGAARL